MKERKKTCVKLNVVYISIIYYTKRHGNEFYFFIFIIINRIIN